ncbi:LysR family transcriptional regulator [Nitrospirillum viridazoti]|uniref:LysR family transcriptional regulator n=1 Tax=Nitrospirillum amazonense TaxID=28077 RepID=A0A560HJJ4_9PROT|nr:LysR family transcriptional regulator [Nitrospirillum amazonense]TWB46663.1 LysR family transcriptional regulator [Nitrospirillum amazonense]
MDKLQAMQVFTRIVEVNSFSKAADTLGLPRASVTTIIQNLEGFLGVRLLQRTTRRLSLTPDGAAYYERAVRILSDIDEAESSFANMKKNPRGKLRVDMPGAIGRLLVIPRVHEFRRQYPDIDLMIGMGDRPVDLVQDGVDCVVRVGHLQDSSLIARRVGVFQGVTCASPAYIAAYGVPETLEDLERHQAVNYFHSRTGKIVDLSFIVEGEVQEVKAAGPVAVNDADAYLTCGLEGLGIIQPPYFMAKPYLLSGQLKELLPRWKPEPMPISAVYPHNRHLSPKVRVFVDWVADLFDSCPLFNGQATSLCPEKPPAPVTVDAEDEEKCLICA